MSKLGKDVLSKRHRPRRPRRPSRLGGKRIFPFVNKSGKRFRVEKTEPSVWHPEGGVQIMTVHQGPAFSYVAKPSDLSKVKADALKVTQGKMSWKTFWDKWKFSS